MGVDSHRWRLILGIGGAAVIALVGGLLWSAAERSTERQETVELRIETTVSGVRFLWDHGLRPIAVLSDGQVVRLEADGTISALGRLPLEAWTDLRFSPDGTQVAIQSLLDEANGLQWQVVNLTTGTTLAALDPAIDLPTWSPEGDRIIYEYALGGGRWNLSIAHPDGSHWRALREVPDPLDELIWIPSETHVLTLSAGRVGALDQIGLSGLGRKSLLEHVVGITVSPDGTRLLALEAASAERTATTTLKSGPIGPDGVGTLASLSGLNSQQVAWSATGNELIRLVREADALPSLIAINPFDGTQRRVQDLPADLPAAARLFRVDPKAILVESGATILRIPLAG